jgi:hypothetical protein
MLHNAVNPKLQKENILSSMFLNALVKNVYYCRYVFQSSFECQQLQNSVFNFPQHFSDT